jgi:hypothetical protein
VRASDFALRRQAAGVWCRREQAANHARSMPRKPAKAAPEKRGKDPLGLSAHFLTATGTTALEAAEAFLAGNLGRDGTESWSSDAFGRERDREVACLESWAKAHNLWLPTSVLRGQRLGGQEHDVAPIKNPKARILKNTKGGFFGVYPLADPLVAAGRPSDRFMIRPATPHQYLRRLILQNQLVAGLNTFEGCTMLSGRLSVIITQPFFAGEPAAEAKSEAFFRKVGFRPICSGAWYHPKENFAVFDASPNNVFDCNGAIIPFDVVALHPGGELRAAILSVLKERRGK